MTTTTRVFVFRCGSCGREDFSLAGRKPRAECPRCGSRFMPKRVIADPHASTVRRAEREDAARGE